MFRQYSKQAKRRENRDASWLDDALYDAVRLTKGQSYDQG